MFGKLSTSPPSVHFPRPCLNYPLSTRFFHLLSPLPRVYLLLVDVSKSTLRIQASGINLSIILLSQGEGREREKRATLVNKFLVKLVPINRSKT